MFRLDARYWADIRSFYKGYRRCDVYEFVVYTNNVKGLGGENRSVGNNDVIDKCRMECLKLSDQDPKVALRSCQVGFD